MKLYPHVDFPEKENILDLIEEMHRYLDTTTHPHI